MLLQLKNIPVGSIIHTYKNSLTFYRVGQTSIDDRVKLTPVFYANGEWLNSQSDKPFSVFSDRTAHIVE